jgi:hypothetical protein
MIELLIGVKYDERRKVMTKDGWVSTITNIIEEALDRNEFVLTDNGKLKNSYPVQEMWYEYQHIKYPYILVRVEHKQCGPWYNAHNLWKGYFINNYDYLKLLRR